MICLTTIIMITMKMAKKTKTRKKKKPTQNKTIVKKKRQRRRESMISKHNNRRKVRLIWMHLTIFSCSYSTSRVKAAATTRSIITMILSISVWGRWPSKDKIAIVSSTNKMTVKMMIMMELKRDWFPPLKPKSIKSVKKMKKIFNCSFRN